MRVILGLLLIAVLGATVAGYYGYRWYTTPQANLADRHLEVVPGTSYRALVQELAVADYIDTPLLWRIAGRIRSVDSRIQAGEYRLPPIVSPESLLEQLSTGAGIVSYSVTLVEGWTLREARQRLAEHPQLQHSLDGVAAEDLLAALGFAAGEPEGRFFPDTYQFNRGDSDADVLRRAYRRMDEALASAWAGRDAGLPYDDPYAALIMASIVEKETGRNSDRPFIAQVFVSRLRLGMKLQTDPTVIYGIGPTFDGDITRAHLRTDTPYNSYTRFGLPPTPIALPGRESLQAAVHPEATDYLYFVARGDGSSQFSRTLAEHHAAVQRFQLNR